MDWDTNELWRRQIERRLNELGSQVKGNQAFQADRISDLIEQIDELRQALNQLRMELRKTTDRQNKIAEYIKTKLANGDPTRLPKGTTPDRLPGD